jgi:hypothetical protein
MNNAIYKRRQKSGKPAQSTVSRTANFEKEASLE